MKTLVVFVGLIFLFSCNNEKLRPISSSIFLHNNSSKVWLLDKELIGEKDYTPLRMQYKQIFVFHKSYKLYIYRLNTLGTQKGTQFSYEINDENKQLTISNDTVEYSYYLNLVSRNKIILTPHSDNIKRTLVLISFPEY